MFIRNIFAGLDMWVVVCNPPSMRQRPLKQLFNTWHYICFVIYRSFIATYEWLWDRRLVWFRTKPINFHWWDSAQDRNRSECYNFCLNSSSFGGHESLVVSNSEVSSIFNIHCRCRTPCIALTWSVTYVSSCDSKNCRRSIWYKKQNMKQ